MTMIIRYLHRKASGYATNTSIPGVRACDLVLRPAGQVARGIVLQIVRGASPLADGVDRIRGSTGRFAGGSGATTAGDG